jgi:hypothetical protein
MRKKIWFKESLPSIIITRNPNYSTKILWYETDYAKEKILSPFKRPTWGRLIASFVLNSQGFIVLRFWWSTYNIPNSGTDKYLTTNTSNSGIDKYYVKKKYDIPDFDVSEY